jgi:crotonobetainyl-CoA:carnitine CoA-transferase CaiB-like acyl-CoA transferase
MLHTHQVIEREDPKVGTVREPGPLVAMSATPAVIGRPAPALDEDGESLRRRGRDVRASPTGPVPTPAAPLAGVVVLELGSYYAAPFGATVLADLGARVIKVEQLDGDPMRSIMPFPEIGGVKVLSGKESVAVDFRTPEGREIVYELARRSDVVLRSFRGGVAERLQLDDATLLAVNPDLVYVNAPGYGVDGPYGHRPAYAPTIGAGGGLAGRNLGPALVNDPDLTLAQVKQHSLRMGTAAMGAANPDALSALGAGTALLLGLLARRRGAPGQSLLTTMLNTLAHALSDDMIEYAGRAGGPHVDPDFYGFHALYRLYVTAQGWVLLAAPTEKEWLRLVRALGDTDPPLGRELGADPRYRSVDERLDADTALTATLAAVFRTRAAADWERDLVEADVACVVVEAGPPEHRLMEGEDCVGRELGLVACAEHAVIGEYLRMRPLATLSRDPGVVRGAPLLGQDTDRVLAELGLSTSQIDDLRARGVVRSAQA